MKTIENLNIAPERVLNDEELIQLKGGKDQVNVACRNGSDTLAEWTSNRCDSPRNKRKCENMGGTFHTCA